ncbi:MAG: YabP/YqfC family sporulation protein, partial [Ruminococcus sp.]|nr:YabP/YqfC family sporulation protein [Ruminococcus sp.]
GIHIAGNKELIIENCRRIEECSDIFMSLASNGLLVQIWGNNLRAFDFKTNGLIIRGKISQIELIERRKKHEKSDSGKCED